MTVWYGSRHPLSVCGLWFTEKIFVVGVKVFLGFEFKHLLLKKWMTLARIVRTLTDDILQRSTTKTRHNDDLCGVLERATK